MGNGFTCKLKIGDRSYGLRKMSPIDGAPFSTKVLKLISPIGKNKGFLSLIEMLGAEIKKDPSEINMEQSEAVKIAMSVFSIFEDIDTELLTNIFKEVVKHDVFAGNDRLSDDITFDQHFQKYPQDYYPVMIWAVVMNTKDFFKGVGDGMSALIKQLMGSPAPAQE